MTRMKNLVKVLLAALSICVAALALSMPASAGPAKSPLGFKVFCLKHPAECRGGGKSSVSLSDDRMAVLKKINVAVNNAIRPANERRGKDVWLLNASVGDCEDYVITKRSRLIKMGFPASALRIAYVKTRRGQDHAVLVVRTDRGDYVLDNLTNAIKPFSQSGHRLVSMSGANPKNWS